MPKLSEEIKPKKKVGRPSNAERAKKLAPPPATAIPGAEPVRPAVAQLSGFKDATELESAIPDNTSTAVAEEKPRRKYTRRTEVETDPLMDDPRYKKAVQNMSALGAPRVVETAFVVTGKPLDKDEKSEMDDFFYVVSKKFSSVDPLQSNWILGLFALTMLLRFVAVRLIGSTQAQLFDQFKGMFGLGEKEEPKKEEIN